MVSGQDASIQDESESHRRPVVGVARNPPASHHLHMLVETARDDLNHSPINERKHIVVQALSVFLGLASLLDDRIESA